MDTQEYDKLMKTKCCPKCCLAKGIEEFHKNSSRNDGLSSWCKLCNKKKQSKNHYKSSKKWRLENPASQKESAQKWRDNNKEKISKATKDWRKKNPEKYKAQRKFQYAIYMGWIIRKPCSICGEVESEAHHDDYNKPYNVRWLCRKHHNRHHAKRKHIIEA